MREIKFRGWDKELNFMINIKRYKIDFNGQVLFDNNDKELYNQTNKIELMQYTGLKDKNDVDIYEGDICRCWSRSDFNGYYEYNRMYEVKWQGSGFEMMVDNCGYGWNYSSGFEYIEVIGNIYENPDLLKG